MTATDRRAGRAALGRLGAAVDKTLVAAGLDEDDGVATWTTDTLQRWLERHPL